MNAHEFMIAFNGLVELIGIDLRQIADDLRTSHPTVTRWSLGRSAPHPAFQVEVLKYLQKRVDEKIGPREAQEPALERAMAQSTKGFEIISRARQLLVDREWCQGALARNRFLGQTEPRKQSATYLDICGALQLAAHQSALDWVVPYNEAFNTLDNITRAKFGVELIEFNDRVANGKDDVLRLLDEVLCGTLR